MATFPSFDPVYSASKNSEPRTRRVQFGDGYEQRLSFGLNQNPKQWQLTFNVSDTDADTIEAFLDARAQDGASFSWSPPDEATTYKWVCPSWNREMYSTERSRINVTFREVFEP